MLHMIGGQRVLSRQLKIRSANGIDRAATVQRLRHEVQVLRATVQEHKQAHAILWEEVVQLRAENRRLWELCETAVIRAKELARSLFGRKSERQASSAPATPPSAPTVEVKAPAEPSPALCAENASPSDPAAAPESTAPPPAAAEPSASPGRRPGQQPGHPGHGRRRYANLPTRHQYLRLPDDELQCPICGVFAQNCGEEVSEQIDFVVRLDLLVTHRQRYRYPCHCREFADPIAGSVTAPAADAAGIADDGAPSRASASGTVNAPVGSLMPAKAGATTVSAASSMSAASETPNKPGPRTLIAPRQRSIDGNSGRNEYGDVDPMARAIRDRRGMSRVPVSAAMA